MSLSKNHGKPTPASQIKELEKNPVLQELCARLLPSNYEFEIAKTVWRIQRTTDCKTVALQMPEGLLLFATGIADVLRSFTGVDTILMGDITYGACCVDDYTAHMLGAQLLVHYGHSCLVPTSVANLVDTIYVFVTIKFDVGHAVESIQNLLNEIPLKENRPTKITIHAEEEEESQKKKLSVALVSTIQFAMSLPAMKELLEVESMQSGFKLQITIPRSKPLSGGEILGCTAPKVKDDLIIYVGDGRFHLEAIMMANPSLEAYRYDPYNKTMTHEKFDHAALSKARQVAVDALVPTARCRTRLTIGVILGTLGRQGNVKPVEHVFNELQIKEYNVFMVLMSEISPAKLNLFNAVDVWVQFACPRLSIDWGSAFSVPILTPYEAIWGSSSMIPQKYEGHPMDYYAYDSLGPHTPNYKPVVAIKSGKS